MKKKQLSHLQIDLMRVLWERGEATVAEVHEAVQEHRPLALTTVATLLKRLEKGGVVGHRTEGRQFVYRPLVSEREIRRSMVADLIDHLFQGDSAALVGHLLTESEIEPGDLKQVRAIIEDAEDEPNA
ncbi:MAG TPA: BlaI/MecI/CopY family transcriptional regulator [Acidobacteriota bacterium]|nr:BlaI/MecI/CopY family transcriptional regulator [Acidobacteriota bacterium]